MSSAPVRKEGITSEKSISKEQKRRPLFVSSFGIIPYVVVGRAAAAHFTICFDIRGNLGDLFVGPAAFLGGVGVLARRSPGFEMIYGGA